MLFPFYADELTTSYGRLRDELRKENDKGDVQGGMIRMKGFALDGWMTSLRNWMSRMAGGLGVLLTPHRRHVYQLLANEMGVDHWKVSVGYGLLQLIVGVSVIFVRGYGVFIVLSMLAIYFAGFALAGYFVRSAVAAGLRSADYADSTD